MADRVQDEQPTTLEFAPIPTWRGPRPTIMNLQAAKDHFFRYDGSRFYMSRDGAEADYQEAGIPPDVEAAWLEELKRAKLCLLSQKGNWRVLGFFLHHADFGHLADFIRAGPKGVLWERCAFLELLLAYARGAKGAGGGHALVSQAGRGAILEAERLLRRARSDNSIGRVRAVLLQAHHLQREIEAD